MIRRHWYLITLITTFVVISLVSKWATKIIGVAYAQATLTPFQAEEWVYSYQNATPALIQKEVTAVNRDGSVATISSLIGMPDRLLRRNVQRVDGVYARIVDDLKLVATTALDPDVVTSLKTRSILAARGCVSEDQPRLVLRTEDVLGLQAIVTQKRTVASVRVIEWLAPQLGCFALRRTNERQQADGTYKLVSEYKIIKVDTGDPPGSLFEVPVGYTEATPSEITKQLHSYLGANLSDASAKHLERSDREYERLHALLPKR